MKLAPSTLGREAAVAAHDPPKSFLAFSLTPVIPPEGPEVRPLVYFAIACKGCGHDAFHLGAFPSAAPQDWSAVDEPVLRPPHRLKCGRCGATSTIFNPLTDGYNGVLCGVSDLARGGPDEAFAPVPLKTYVAATYNIALWELEDLSAEANGDVKPTDLFDWINIIQSTPDKDFHLELDYSCA